MGNNVERYESKDGTTLSVNHVGFVNVSAALSWIYENIEQPESIFVSGCSAGSVGSAMHAPYIIEQYPDTPVAQLGDSLAFVLPHPIDMQTIWQARDNFPEWVEGMPGLQQRDFEMSEFYSMITSYYPEYSFGQINSLHDRVQVSNYVDLGGREEDWVNDYEASLSAIHANAPNFNSLTFGGKEHCVLDRSLFYTYEVDGVRLRDWLADYAACVAVATKHCTECDEPEIIE